MDGLQESADSSGHKSADLYFLRLEVRVQLEAVLLFKVQWINTPLEVTHTFHIALHVRKKYLLAACWWEGVWSSFNKLYIELSTLS